MPGALDIAALQQALRRFAAEHENVDALRAIPSTRYW